MKPGIASIFLATFVLDGGSLARAHMLAPSLLEIRETGAGRAVVLWKTPVIGIPGANLRPVLPPECVLATQPELSHEETALLARWEVDCGPASLVGKRIAATGIADSRADVWLRITLRDGRSLRAVLSPGHPSFLVPERQQAFEVARSYAPLGVEHILTGADHLLFVLGLLLLIAERRLLLWTLTSFTFGHSVTLSLAVLGWVTVPQAQAEAAIAFGIFVLAVELTRDRGRPPSLMRRFPWAMAALFGLLHGLGFAGALAEIGLPPGEIPLALFSFNVGIEAGQILFVVAVLVVRRLLELGALRWPQRASLVPAYAIGSLAAFWLFARLAAVLGI